MSPAVAVAPVSCDQVIDAVAQFYSVKAADIRGPRRHKSLARARAIAMYLARQLTEKSYPELGRSFGGRHHTSVLSACQQMALRHRKDDRLFLQLSAIERMIKRGRDA
jgi:chromosomal replication initiator protein